ncbi:hypothetical protein B0I35DRAFT_474038 [Stachybotrys elegans]|uniref:Enoyl reductase (ER) domain-containing protein n=1 Tax=Stachybotrys elegans TaxID=80388 RepID=A0A8K0T402_9HYPO|nr:hypothetical protein B0I35DRAFT_474038 [Stachybotrys elegans]
MPQEIPKTTKQWKVVGRNGFDSLQFDEKAPVPEYGDRDVVVRIHAVSLNYRDLVIPKNMYPFPTIDEVIPGSDGAGEVLAVGKHVTRFKPGDKVVTLFHQGYIAGPVHTSYMKASLGGAAHGTLRNIAAFDQDGLVHMPTSLSYREASTLPCAGVTAWNALFGVSDNKLTAGQWVVTQGTGGVSIFAVQFAKAVGARVIATTSSAEKAKLLEKLGADHILNYSEDKEWGVTAKKLTGGEGVHHVIEVAGPTSMKQSLAAIRPDGIISIIGFRGGQSKEQPSFLDCLGNVCTARGIFVGHRLHMEEMCDAIEANPDKLRPIVDPKTFKLEQLKEAFDYMWNSKHQAKVVIDLD